MTLQRPADERAVVAANLKDPSTPEGAAIAGLIPRIEIDPDGVPVLVIGE
jgi:hypothetical protein